MINIIIKSEGERIEKGWRNSLPFPYEINKRLTLACQGSLNNELWATLGFSVLRNDDEELKWRKPERQELKRTKIHKISLT